MKGIILAGGSGTRLYPSTIAICKQMLPVYDKPLIYYPLSVLILAGIKDILVISTPKDIPLFRHLLRDGTQLGIRIDYEVQLEPKGLADAFLIGKKFIGKDNVCLILGDNIFYGQGFQPLLIDASKLNKGALIFGYWVKDPECYGVVELDDNLRAISLCEKPKKPKSNYAIPGLYFYDNDVVKFAETIQPSKRGELEITELNNMYLRRNILRVVLLGRGFAWLDAGTHEAYLEANDYVATIEKRQGLKVACIEEVAYRMGFIDADQVNRLAKPLMKSGYGQYLLNMLKYDVRGVIR